MKTDLCCSTFAKIILLFEGLFFITINCSVAQNTQITLAQEYFQNQEYKKAAAMYEKIIRQTDTRLYFKNYLTCLMETEEYKLAEKSIKKRQRQLPEELAAHVWLADVYEKQNQHAKAENERNTAIGKIGTNQREILQLAQEFTARQNINFAIETYLAARKKSPAEKYRHELAELYGIQSEFEKMIEEYLVILQTENNKLEQIKTKLLPYLAKEDDNEVSKPLKKQLLKKIQSEQKQSRTVDFYELFIWTFEQKKEFNMALRQVIALDKRMDKKGNRVLSFGQLAVRNKFYDVALEAFNYLLEKETTSPMASIARLEQLNVLYLKLKEGQNNTPKEIAQLEKKYREAIKEEMDSESKANAIIQLADILAFHLNKADESIEVLNKLIDDPNLMQATTAKAKLKLADIKMLTEDIWDASLILAQVEKENKENPTGHEAKFRKARLAYFTGDFDWAKAQLDILKASTSKLIANDALDLSVLILENADADSASHALSIYARAELLLLQHNYTEAIVNLDSIIDMYPGHPLSDETLYLKAQVMKQQNKYTDCEILLTQIATTYKNELKADDAIFELGRLYELKLNDPQKAMEQYKKIITNYQNSIYLFRAREYFRKLRGDFKPKTEF